MFLKNKIQNTLSNNTFKNVFILFSGSSIAQIIPLLATIVLTRIFTKDQFGIFFIYSSLGMVLSMVISLKLELAIVLPKKREDSSILFITSLIITLTLSIVILFFIITFFNPITSLLGEKSIGNLLYILPLSLLSLGIISNCNYWFNSNDQYKNISIAKIVKSTTSSISQILLGIFIIFNNGLVFGLIIGHFFSAFYSLFKSFKNQLLNFREFTLKRAFELVTKYKSIPIFNTSIAVSNTLSNHLPIFLLTFYYGLEMTAFYGLANRIIATPMGLIGQSVGQVFYKNIAEKYNQGINLRKTVVKTYIKLAKYAIIPFLLFFIIAPYFFSLVFGSEWRMAGNFSQILIPWLFLMFLNSPISYIFTVLNKQKQFLIYDILLLITRFLALYIGHEFFNNVWFSIFLYSLVGVIFNLFLLFYILKISNTQIKIETN